MNGLNSGIVLLLLVALLLIVIGGWRRSRLWRQGRPAPVNWLAGLAAMPRRYLVDLHAVVHRDRYMSNTHVATAGGLVLALVLLPVQYLLPGATWVTLLLLAASASTTIGAGFVWWRRRNPPPRLSRGPWMRLPYSLLAIGAALFVISLLRLLLGDAMPGVAGWLLFAVLLAGVALGLAELVIGVALGGPMKHAFAGALHLAFHRRPERFGGGRSSGLKPLFVDAAIAENRPLGAGKPADFTWNQLLGFDACVQCGRCEAVCPAFAAGQPLNPKKLIQDMVVGLSGGTDDVYAGSRYPGRTDSRVAGDPQQVITDGLVHADTLWSCTTCRACVEECPMMIEHVDAIVDMRRYITLEKGETPVKGVEVLENLIATDNPGGLDPAKRLHWTADQALPLIADKGEADVLLWVGDGAFDMRSQKILRALVRILKAAKVDFAILGDEEKDCGDLARRLGDEATFEALARQNIEALKRYSFGRIVTSDPHAFHVLSNEYADFGGSFQVMHHSTFIHELVVAGNLRLDGAKLASRLGRVTWHDPCYLGRYNGEYEAPRQLLEVLGLDYAEMERSRFRSRCCGGGGAAPVTDVAGERRIADMRMADVIAVDAQTVVVGCQQCTAMLEGVVEPRPQVIELAEVIVDALLEDSDQRSSRNESAAAAPQAVVS